MTSQNVMEVISKLNWRCCKFEQHHNQNQPKLSEKCGTNKSNDLEDVSNILQKQQTIIQSKTLPDRDGWDREYDEANDVSIQENTLYIAETRLARPSDWYD